jgi:hypothetical protein
LSELSTETEGVDEASSQLDKTRDKIASKTTIFFITYTFLFSDLFQIFFRSFLVLGWFRFVGCLAVPGGVTTGAGEKDERGCDGDADEREYEPDETPFF